MGIDIAVAGVVVCKFCFLVHDGEGIGKKVAGGRVGKKDACFPPGAEIEERKMVVSSGWDLYCY